jgi:hypothetical protein
VSFVLSRLYGFNVSPQKGVDPDQRGIPFGGMIRLSPRVQEVVANAISKVSANALTTVDFELDGDRAHTVREEVIAVAFGLTQAPKAAAGRLASRLAGVMDGRSKAALLLIMMEAQGDKRQISMFMLPKEDVAVMTGVGAKRDTDLDLNLVRDAFSTGSALRKMARLSGHNGKTQFLSVEVLDFESMSEQRRVADFWIRDFLSAVPRMDSQTGTNYLTSALQRAFDAAPEKGRDAVFAAILKVSSGMVPKTSLAKSAEEIPVELHGAYFKGIDAGEVRRTLFNVDLNLVKTSLARRIFTSKEGVIISAPASTVGRSVTIGVAGDDRTVSYSGTIYKERVARGRRERPE